MLETLEKDDIAFDPYAPDPRYTPEVIAKLRAKLFEIAQGETTPYSKQEFKDYISKLYVGK